MNASFQSGAVLESLAVVIREPERIELSRLELLPPSEDDVIVDVEWSGISTGTERLLWSGRMPPFPGLAYPLVPGYESVGRISRAGTTSGRREGERVFVPGARCYVDVRGLFGGASSRVVIPGAKATPSVRSQARPKRWTRSTARLSLPMRRWNP